jgi:hypothetical protein
MIGRRVSAHVVKARWAYSELESTRFGTNYTGFGSQELHEKKAAGVPFSALTSQDHDALVQMLYVARNQAFAQSVDNYGSTYECQAWTRGQLVQVWALPAYNPPAKKAPVPYYDFYIGVPNTGPGGTAEEGDARVAAKRIPLDLPPPPDAERRMFTLPA